MSKPIYNRRRFLGTAAVTGAALTSPVYLRRAMAQSGGEVNIWTYSDFVPESFRKQFEADTGISPRVYLNTQRVERAVQAVANETRSFSAISNDLGFSVPAHFSRFFHDHAGSSPSVFRNVSTLRDTI